MIGGRRSHTRTILLCGGLTLVVLVVLAWGWGSPPAEHAPTTERVAGSPPEDDIMNRVVTWHGDGVPFDGVEAAVPPYNIGDARGNPLAQSVACECAWAREGSGGGCFKAPAPQSSSSDGASHGQPRVVPRDEDAATFISSAVCGGMPAAFPTCLAGTTDSSAAVAAQLLQMTGDLKVTSRTASVLSSGYTTYSTTKVMLGEFVQQLEDGEVSSPEHDGRDITLRGEAVRVSHGGGENGDGAVAAVAAVLGSGESGIWTCGHSESPTFDWGIGFESVWVGSPGMSIPERTWSGPMGRFFVGVAGPPVTVAARPSVAAGSSFAVESRLERGDVVFVPKDWLLRVQCDAQGGDDVSSCILGVV